MGGGAHLRASFYSHGTGRPKRIVSGDAAIWFGKLSLSFGSNCLGKQAASTSVGNATLQTVSASPSHHPPHSAY